MSKYSFTQVEQLPPGTTGHVEEDDALCLPSADERFGEEEIHRWTEVIYEFRGEDGYSRFVRLYKGKIVTVLCIRPCGEVEWVFSVEGCRRMGFARTLFYIASSVRGGQVKHQAPRRCTPEGNLFIESF